MTARYGVNQNEDELRQRLPLNREDLPEVVSVSEFETALYIFVI